MKFNKLLSISMLTLLLASCAPVNEQEGEFAGQTLTIYNVADYISNGEDGSVDLIAKFEEEYGVKVNYYTYDTNETMYNQFKLQKEGTYDLVCTSDYMIQKMVKEGLMEPFEDYEENIPNYYNYGASFLRNKLKSMEVELNGKTVNLDQYAVGYMWGTLGIIYDPECSETIREDVHSWDVFYDEQYKDKISIKNSMRDAYVVGLMHYYSQDEDFRTVMDTYLEDENGNTDAWSNFNLLVQEVFDFKLDGSEESNNENYEKIQHVKEELIALKENIFGLETDSGKNDMVEGSKIKMDLAYSGDAVYSIDTAADEADKLLEYYVPDDGSNNWFDCWMLPKGSNKNLAYKFLDFISDPYNACDNMDYIGYTPFVVCDAVFDNVANWYGAAEFCGESYYYAENEEEEIDPSYVVYKKGDHKELFVCIKNNFENDELIEGITPDNDEYFESLEYDSESEYAEGDMFSYNGKIYNCIADAETGIDPTNEDYFEENTGYDISYLFKDVLGEERNPIIYPWYGSENELETQYPSEKILARCAIMNDFGEFNNQVIIMWGQFKAYADMTPTYIFLGCFVGIVLILSLYFVIKNKSSIRYRRNRKK